MNAKSLKKLKRSELLEMLLDKTKEAEVLAEEVKELKEQLSDKRIKIDNAGSLSEAVLALSGIMDTAESAAKIYLYNIQQLKKETEESCDLKKKENLAEILRIIYEAVETVEKEYTGSEDKNDLSPEEIFGKIKETAKVSVKELYRSYKNHN